MGVFENLPHTDFHELNLDWTIRTAKDADDRSKAAINEAVNTRDYVNNYFAGLDLMSEVQTIIDTMAEDGSLNELIDPLILNTLPPEVVDAVEDMTDKNRSYILRSNSHIYQWRDGAFYDTGVVYGSSIGNVWTFYGAVASPMLLADLPVQSIYEIRAGYVPSDAALQGTGFVFTAGSGSVYKYQIYVRLTTGKQYYRYFANNAWSAWIDPVESDTNLIRYAGFLSSNFNANDAEIQTVKLITTPNNTVLNIPEYSSGFLFTYGRAGSTRQQIYLTFNTNVQYSRRFSAGAWSSWITGSLSYYGIASTNNDLLPGGDANNAPGMSVYLHQTGSGVLNVPANTGAYLITIGQTGTARGQIFLSWYTGEYWYRRSTSNSQPTWSDWTYKSAGGQNSLAKMLSVGNSILTGSVHINGSFDHLVPYESSPYGCIANAIGIPQNNVTHELHSSTGILYDPGQGNFNEIIQDKDLSGYDVLVTQVSMSDMSYPLGTVNSVAADGSIAGAVKQLVNIVRSSNSKCQIILVAPAPDNTTITGPNAFTGLFPNGHNLAECEALLSQLADMLHFTMLGWQDLNISYAWQDYTDAPNLHFNNDTCYRIVGAYLGGQASAHIHF